MGFNFLLGENRTGVVSFMNGLQIPGEPSSRKFRAAVAQLLFYDVLFQFFCFDFLFYYCLSLC